jgi:ectoine hydroxylase-related dioxygenase (phytanoyl-CoA dioxygenase family)
MSNATSLITEEEQAFYAENGYLLVKGLVSEEGIAVLVERLEAYMYERLAMPEGIRIQVEPRVERGEVPWPERRGDAYRKMDRLVIYDEVFRALATKPEVVERMQILIGSENLKLFRDAVLMKPAQVGSAKGMHQDSPYWPIEPMELSSCWMPFEPATAENGCMTVIPGSHKRGPVPHERVPDDYIINEQHYNTNDVIAVPMDGGDGLFFHSLLLHGTAPNLSAQSRRAITMSYMATEFHYTGEPPQPEYLRISGQDVPGGV